MNGIFIHQQIKALQSLGAECQVILLHNWFPPYHLHKLHPYWVQGYKQKNDFFTTYEGVEVHAVPMFVKMPSRFFKDTFYNRAANALKKYINKNKRLKNADWLYAHFLTPMGFIGAQVKDDIHMKLAVIARGDDVHAWPERDPALVSHFPLVFDKADLVLANSKNLGEDAKKWMQPDNIRNVHVAYNGIDYTKFYPVKSIDEKNNIRTKYGLYPNLKYIICIATRVQLKGWIELLETIKLAGTKFDGWILLIVAPERNAPDALDLKALAKEFGITNKIEDLGHLSPDDLAAILRASDAFVLASYNEGMANSLLEAMASGLPCIATEVGGHNEVIEHLVDGILIPPKSVTDLLYALCAITESSELRKKLGANARKRMLQFGDYQQNAKKLLMLFENP